MMRHKLRRALLASKKTCLVTGLAAIAAALCSCESRQGRDPQLEAEVVESLRTAIRKQGDGSAFDLAEVVTFDWDMAHVFTPYTSKETVNEALGSRIDGRGIDLQDSFNLLVFTRNGGVVLTVKVPRGVCDLQHPDQPYRNFRVANGSARFQVAIDETGWCRARSDDGMLD
jgi:hypothetical protein